MHPELTRAAARFRQRRQARRGRASDADDRRVRAILDAQLGKHRKALGEMLIGDWDIGDAEIIPAGAEMSEADRRAFLSRFAPSRFPFPVPDREPAAVIPIERGRKR